MHPLTDWVVLGRSGHLQISEILHQLIGLSYAIILCAMFLFWYSESKSNLHFLALTNDRKMSRSNSAPTWTLDSPSLIRNKYDWKRQKRVKKTDKSFRGQCIVKLSGSACCSLMLTLRARCVHSTSLILHTHRFQNPAHKPQPKKQDIVVISWFDSSRFALFPQGLTDDWTQTWLT